MTASAFSAPRRSVVGSSRSPRCTSAPAAVSCFAPASERVRPSTWCPAWRSSGMIFEPMKPVAPVRKIRITFLRLYLAEGAHGGASWLAALTDPQLYGAIAAMHDEPGHPWTLEKLARRAGMSRTVFALRFKEVVGETATEYLTRWRMLLAAERLTAGGEPVARIASALGYESESSFGKAFRRVIGHPPRRFARGPAR